MAPNVSVVVVARDRAALTLRCLTALARLPDEPTFEVVLVDDGSTDETPAILDAIEGDLVAVRNDEPAGLAVAWDQGVAASSGQHVVLLHDDAVPCEGWLSALVDPFNANGDVGAARPRCIDLAGAFLPEPHWLALAVRRAAYDDVGGFAGTEAPGKAQKLELLDALRRAGWGVTLAPKSILLLVPDALAPA
jgi:GT2 family glycosyltransferase